MATQYVVSTGAITLAANTAKVAVEFPTGASAGLTVVALEVMFSATAAGSCVVEWGTYSAGGTATTVTPLKHGTGQGVAAITGTVKVNNSVNPSGFSAAGLPSWIVPLPGMYAFSLPLGRELFQPASVNRCIRLTSTIGTTARLDLYFEQ